MINPASLINPHMFSNALYGLKKVLWILLDVPYSNAGIKQDTPSGISPIHISQFTETTSIFLIVSLILLIVIGAVFYLKMYKSIKVQRQFISQLLFHHERERERISKELHNSVGQNILFIRNQLIKSEQADLIHSIDEAIGEIRDISKDLYPTQLEKYGLSAAVDALMEKAAESDIFTSHDLEVFNQNIDYETKINCYRVIHECVSNSLRHAEATALRVSARIVNGKMELIIQDNGKGFDKSILKQKNKSMGIPNIKARVKYLRGYSELETSPGNGTKFTLLIPV